MDIKKLKEEIKLLERKVELLEQWTELQRLADEYNRKAPVYPNYPVYPLQYPWWQTYPNWRGTSDPCYTIGPAISGITTGGASGQASSNTTYGNDGVPWSYTDC